MPGHIEFWNHTNAACRCISDHIPHLLLRVIEAVGPHLLQLRIDAALDPESLILGQVPVEYVEFDGGHSIERAIDNLNGHKVTAAIEHEAAPLEPRRILNVHAGKD